MPAKALKKIEPQFDPKTGYLISLKSEGSELLHAPLIPNFWRAPTDNDIGAKNHTKAALWEDVMVKAKLAVFEKKENGAHAEYALPQETKLVIDYRCEATAITVTSKLIFADKNTLPHVPKIGYQVVLAGNYEQIQYYGKGPHENYWDRQESAAISTFALRTLQTDNYVRPQENGNRCGIHWMSFSQQKFSVSIQAESQPLMMSAWHYLQQDLEKAKHAVELKSRDDLLTVNIDHLHMGVGGDNSWGLPVHPEYTIPPKGTYAWAFTMSVTGHE